MNKHTSKPYNPNIAYVFYLAGFIESWGRGVEKICNALRAESLPMPEYTVNPGDIMIKFTGPEDRIIRVTDRLSDQLSEKLSDKLSDKEKLTLELLVEDPGYTSPQIADKMGGQSCISDKVFKGSERKEID